jgi:archaellum biogenesis ATPase FlaH
MEYKFYVEYLLKISNYLKDNLEFEGTHMLRTTNKLKNNEKIKKDNLVILDKLNFFIEDNYVSKEEIDSIARKLDNLITRSRCNLLSKI